MHRTPPVVPEIVAYLDYAGVVKDAQNQPPWVVLHSDARCTTLGLYDTLTHSLKFKVVVESDFNTSVIYEGIIVFILSQLICF